MLRRSGPPQQEPEPSGRELVAESECVADRLGFHQQEAAAIHQAYLVPVRPAQPSHRAVVQRLRDPPDWSRGTTWLSRSCMAARPSRRWRSSAVDAAPDGLGERDAQPIRPPLERTVLALRQLNLGPHHDGMPVPSWWYRKPPVLIGPPRGQAAMGVADRRGPGAAQGTGSPKGLIPIGVRGDSPARVRC